MPANKKDLSEALEVFIKTMRPYVANVILNATGGQSWEDDFVSKLYPQQQELWANRKSKGAEPINLIDYSNLPIFGRKYKNSLIEEVGDKYSADRLIHYFIELRDIRNNHAHFETLTEDEIRRAFLNMTDSANLLEMQDLYEKLKEIEAGKEKQKRCDLEIIRSFEQEMIKYRPDVFGYELRIQGEAYFLIFGYRPRFAYCDLIADRVGQPLPKEDRLIREWNFERRTPRTQPSYLIREFEPTTTMGEGKKFLDEILEILKEN